MKKLYLFLLLISFWSTSFSQNTFEKIIDSPDQYGEQMKASCINDSGEIVILSSNEMEMGMTVVKVSSVGDTLWHKSYSTTNGSLYGQSICKGSDSGYLIAGQRNDNFGQDIYLLKIDENGQSLWEKQIGEINGSDICYDAKPVSGEGYVLTGRIYDSGEERSVLLMTDSNGEELWRKTKLQITGITDNYNTQARSIEVLSDGFLIAGDCSTDTQQGFVMKTDLSGDQLWSINLGNANNEYIQKVVLLSNDEIAFVGRREYQTYNSSYSLIWYGKLDASGSLVWENELRESNYNYGYDIVEDSEGNFLIAGSVYSQDYSNDPYLAKVDSQGSLLWEKVFGGNNSGSLKTCHLSGDYIYGIGTEIRDWNWGSESYTNGNFMVKTDLNGNVNELEVFNTSNNYCEGDGRELRTLGFMTSYLWNTQNTDNNGYSTYVYSAGDYSVSAVDRNGNTRQSNTITIYPKPVPNISFTGETTFCRGGEITLSTSIEYQSYEWFRTDTLENNNLQLTSVGNQKDYVANETADYSIQVTDEHGCKNNVNVYDGFKERVTVIDPKVQIQSVTSKQINLVLGDGKEVNGERVITQPAPWGSYKKSSHQQYLIRADELLTMGVEANSELKEMAFYIEKANNTSTAINGFKIRMASTTKTELRGLSNTESFLDVNNDYWLYEGNEMDQTLTSGWRSLNISSYDYSTSENKGFVWDGVSNIIVDVAYYNDQQTTYSNQNSIFRLTEMGYNASWVRFATDDMSYQYSGGTASTLRPNMRFKVELPSGDTEIVGCGTEVNLKLNQSFFEVEWSTGSTDDQITVVDDGTISVTTTDDYGCVATDSKEIKLSSFDVEILADKTTFCEGDQANLSIQGDYPFLQWNTGETTSNILASESGKYSIEARNEDACVAKDTVKITEISRPSIFENIGHSEITPGQEIAGYTHLGDLNGHQYYLSNSNNTYSWYDAKRMAQEIGGHLLTISDDEENAFVQKNILSHNNVWLGLSDNKVEGEWEWNNGELFSYTNWQESHPQDDELYTEVDYSYIEMYSGKWSSCQGYNSFLVLVEFDFETPKQVTCDSTILVAAGDFTSHTWYKDGLEIGNEASIVVKETGIYTVSGLTKVGCSLTSDPIEISKVSISPVVDGIVSGSLCTGEGSVNIDAGAGFASYLWSTGETSQSISVTDQDYYSVTVKNSDACATTEEFALRCKIYVSPDGNDTNGGTQANPLFTIQHAIDVATAGDTIIVKDGTYLENLSLNKSIVLGSEFIVDGNRDHIANTILDGQALGTVVKIAYGGMDTMYSENTDEQNQPAGLIGFTIQNGKSDSYNENETGGGINLYYWSSGKFELKDLIITGNEARRGGGISSYYSSCLMENLTIESNKSNEEGSGIYLESSTSMEVKDIIVKNNEGNNAFRIGTQNDLVISNLQLIENQGSGLYIYSNNSQTTRVTLENPLIVKNRDYGIQIESGTLDVINGTIANNQYGIYQGWQENHINIFNTIISGNRYQQIVPSYSQDYDHIVNVNYSAVEKGLEGIQTMDAGNTQNSGEVNWGEGNLETAIQFVDTLNNDYSLIPTSPAIGSGISELIVDGVTYSTPLADLYGTARPNPVDSKPDMGAIENEKGVGDLNIQLSECGGDITLEVFNKEVKSILWTGPDEFTSTEQNLVNVTEGIYNVSVTDAEGTIVTATIEVKDPLRFTSDIKHVCAAVGEANGRIEIQVAGGKPKDYGYESQYHVRLIGEDYYREEYPYVYNENVDQSIAQVSFNELKAGFYTLNISDNSCTLDQEIEILSKEGRQFFVSNEGDDDNIGYEELPLSLIQTAIDRACDLDTIIVEPGVYTENIRFNGKNVTLASRYILDKDESFISQTTLDGNEEGSVVSFQNGESRDAKLIGFTIQNGREEMNNYNNGGGVTIQNSNPSLDHLIIQNNRSRNGGGLYISDSEASLKNISFEGNIATDNGDALYIQNIYSEAVIDDLTFKGEANSYCKVYMNQYTNVEFGHLSFENFGQTAMVISGGSYEGNGVVFNNLELKFGQQGVKVYDGYYTFKNLVASDISSEVINLENNAKVALINSTLVNNNQAVRMSYGDSKLLVLNSILRNESGQEITYETGMDGYGKSIEIHHSNIKGGQKGIVGEEKQLQNFTYDESNFDRDEYFVDAENGDFHLLDISPSVGAGISSLNVFDTDYTMASFDFDGLVRSIPTGSSVDLGAFENESISRKIIHAISCNGGTDGSISIEMLSGKAPFSYIWDDDNATKEAKVLATEADKMYHVLVTDSDGQIYRDSAWVTQPDELIAFVVDSTNISRQGLADGEISIGVSGGNEPYSYYWEDIEKTTSSVNNLEADKFYNVTVIDEKGCQAHKSTVLKVLPILENNLCGFASEDGEIKLNSTNINAIETDFEGTIWFATGEELTSYNGKDWNVINANFSYRSIHKDKVGNIWLGAEWGDKGLNMYDGKSWYPYKETDGLAGNNVYGITEDTYGNLWIATDKGVSRFDGEEFTNFDKNDGLLENQTMTVFADKDGYIWVGSNSGISRYKTLSKDQGEDWENFQYQDEISLGGIQNFVQDKEGNIWMSSAWASDGQSGLIKFDGTSWSRVDMNLDITLTSITDIYCDVEGSVWVGSSEGLTQFDGTTWHFYQKDIELPSNYVSAIGEDAYGAIWVGYSDGDNGISKYFNGQWTTLYKSNGSNNNSIQAMAVDENQNLWVGTSDWSNSLKRFDGNTWKIFNSEDGYQGYVYDLDTDSELKVWVGTDQGLYKYNGTTFDKYDTANGLQSNNIKGISIDANDKVWISYEGAYEGSGGLDLFFENKITHFSTDDNLLEDDIRDVQADSKGNIWISYGGNSYGVLSRYDGAEFTTFDPNEEQEADNYSIDKLFVDSKDRVWISNQYRLAVYDGTSWNYHDLTEKGLAADNYINSIGEDADGNIWIGYYNMYNYESSQTGAFKYNGTNWVPFSQEDGLYNSPITCIQDDYKGHIWFGSQSGMIRYTKCTNEEVIVTVNNGGCSGEGDRKLILTPTGENAPYQYSIDNGASFQAENIFSGLIAGSYHLLVKNKNGELIADRELMITEPVPLRANVEGVNVTCNGRTDGAAVCLPTGGTGPYTFIWDDVNATTTARVEGLSEGVEYTVTIIDANECTATGTISVGHDPHLKFTDWSNVSCNGLTDGMAVITPIGGKMPFRFQWDDINNTTDSIVNSLSGDKYHFVTVTDANDCVAIDSIKLEQPEPFIATAVHFNSCDGENTGGIELSISGGTVPYDYKWDNDENETGGNIYKLGAGTYSVLVKDASGCETEASSTIVELDDPQSVEIIGSKEEYFCPEATELVATDGFASYKWSTGETEMTIVPDLPGEHYVRVFADNGCSAIDTIEIHSLRTYQDQQLCLVTVNQDNKNEIVWERRDGLGIVSYNIYKESNTASSYELVKNISIDEKSALVDEESDPSSRSHTYAISIVDVCGVESRMSDIHHTMLLQANQGINGVVNLDWNKYEGFEFETYNIYRGTSVENMTLWNSISNTESKIIDNNPPDEEQFYYVLEVQNDYTCDPSQLKSSFTDYSVSRSNYLAAKSVPTGIKDPEYDVKSLIIYPNPMKDKSRIEFNNSNFSQYCLSVYDTNGRLVLIENNINSNRFELERGKLSSGQYIIEVRGENLYRGRLIIE